MKRENSIEEDPLTHTLFKVFFVPKDDTKLKKSKRSKIVMITQSTLFSFIKIAILTPEVFFPRDLLEIE